MVDAMACGLPCVVTELPGITDFVFQKGRTGAVVPRDDPRALVDATAGLLGNPSASREMGRAAREDAVSRFDIDTIAGLYVEYYQALLAGMGRRCFD